MLSFDDTVISVQTKHPGVRAFIHSYWESWGEGKAVINFILDDYKNNVNFLIAKSFYPKSTKYTSGDFNNDDVLRDYGQQFNEWVKKVNRQSNPFEKEELKYPDVWKVKK